MHMVCDWIIPVCIRASHKSPYAYGDPFLAIPVCIRGSRWLSVCVWGSPVRIRWVILIPVLVQCMNQGWIAHTSESGPRMHMGRKAKKLHMGTPHTHDEIVPIWGSTHTLCVPNKVEYTCSHVTVRGLRQPRTTNSYVAFRNPRNLLISEDKPIGASPLMRFLLFAKGFLSVVLFYRI